MEGWGVVRDGLSEEEVVQPSPRWGEGIPALQAERPPRAKAWRWETAQHVLETEQSLGGKKEQVGIVTADRPQVGKEFPDTEHFRRE